MNFNAANKWLKSRVNVPTVLGSRELALSPDFEAKVKAHAFFSAKVAESHVLEKLRTVSDSYSRGEINKAEARTTLKKFLYGQGYQPDDVADAPAKEKNRAISNLASTARLDLILNQNAAMAAAVGQREISMDPDVMERFPNYRYNARDDARSAHAALDNLVLPKTDPFWSTHTPPWEYNCRCWLEDEESDTGSADVSSAIKKHSGWAIENNGQLVTIPAVPESGYVFDVSEAFETCDMSRLKNIEPRRAVFDSLHNAAKKGQMNFVCVPGESILSAAPVAGDGKAAADYLARQKDNYNANKTWLNDSVVLGQLDSGVKDALGITESGSVTLSGGTKAYGLEHMKQRHLKDILDGSFNQAIQETLFSSGNRHYVNLNGGNVTLCITNPKTGAFATLHRKGQNWDWQIVSIIYPGQQHISRKGILTK